MSVIVKHLLGNYTKYCVSLHMDNIFKHFYYKFNVVLTVHRR